MGTALALLPSPLLGPAVWSPAADVLSRHGWTVLLPAVPRVAPRTPADVVRSILSSLPADEDLVVIPHSNAGLYVPTLSSQRRIVGSVFVDAGLPAHDGQVALAPPTFLELLEAKADSSGLLPPWTDWWEESDLAPLFPDAETRARVERDQFRLPLSYFRESLPVPVGWDTMAGAYLAFGDTYAADRREAAQRAWPVSTLAGGHLHLLVEPEQVAAEITALLAAIGVDPPAPRGVR